MAFSQGMDVCFLFCSICFDILFYNVFMSLEQIKNRKVLLHQNKPVYQWEESLDTITIFIQPPPIPANLKISSVIEVKFKSNWITIGIKGNPPYISHQTQGIVDTSQSLWYCVDSPKQKGKKQIVVQVQKAQKGVRWGCVFKGHKNLNPFEEEQLKKKMMLERFQEEHPGFDFSGAQLNGVVPEARTFMGGMKGT